MSLKVWTEGGLSSRDWECKTVRVGNRFYPCYMVCPLCGKPTLHKNCTANTEKTDVYELFCDACEGGTDEMIHIVRNRPYRIRRGRGVAGWDWAGVRSEAQTVGILKRFMLTKEELEALRLGRAVARELMEEEG